MTPNLSITAQTPGAGTLSTATPGQIVVVELPPVHTIPACVVRDRAVAHSCSGLPWVWGCWAVPVGVYWPPWYGL